MDTDYKMIGKRIAIRRRELGLKQSQVEERAEIGDKYLSNIERGISVPSIEVIMKLSSVLETTPDYFLVGANKNNENDIDEMVVILKRLDSKKYKQQRVFWIGFYKIIIVSAVADVFINNIKIFKKFTLGTWFFWKKSIQ